MPLSEGASILTARAAPMSGRDFDRLSALIRSECGIKMPPSKKVMLEARLQRRLRSLDIASFAQYCEYLNSPDGMERELVHMLDAVTTNKTEFFREPDHFNFLLGKALPELTLPGGPACRRGIRVWSAGCSTGEEPYTLAMVLSEFSEGRPGFRFSILATDISTRVLERADLGIYPAERVGPVPEGLRKKYLLRGKDKSVGLVRVAPELRALVEFGRLNLMDDDYGFREGMDVVFCRNVLIYFDRPTQERLLGRLCRCLAPGAFLFIGHAETLAGLDLPLTQSAPTVYRRI